MRNKHHKSKTPIFSILDENALWFCSETALFSNIIGRNYEINLIGLLNFCTDILQTRQLLRQSTAKWIHMIRTSCLLQLHEIATMFICILITILLPLIHTARVQTNSIFDSNSDCFLLISEGELPRTVKVYIC